MSYKIIKKCNCTKSKPFTNSYNNNQPYCRWCGVDFKVMNNKEINNKLKKISKELKELSIKFEEQGLKNFHNLARYEINKKYGKGWREDLELMKTEKFIKMNYY